MQIIAFVTYHMALYTPDLRDVCSNNEEKKQWQKQSGL